MCNNITILGETFPHDCKFNIHVKNKLVKANKCLYVLRSLRKEGYKQIGIDLLFKTIVRPNFTYTLSVFGVPEPDLAPIQIFLEDLLQRNLTYILF